ncbi:MAG: STAS domain-containing protein [Tepidisphaeraceae bacterium]|jgi:anti-sigma B factor antagonist
MEKQTQDYVVRELDGVTVVRFTNKSLTATHDLDRIAHELNELVATGTHRIVLDFKHVEYISSAALGMMISLHKRLDDLKGGLILSHPENIADLLRVSRTDKFFRTAADPKVAVKIFSGQVP